MFRSVGVPLPPKRFPRLLRVDIGWRDLGATIDEGQRVPMCPDEFPATGIAIEVHQVRENLPAEHHRMPTLLPVPRHRHRRSALASRGGDPVDHLCLDTRLIPKQDHGRIDILVKGGDSRSQRCPLADSKIGIVDEPYTPVPERIAHGIRVRASDDDHLFER